MAIAGDPGVPRHIFPEDRNDIAPRMGMTYALTADGKTALRGATGLYYGPLPLASKTFLNQEPFGRSLNGNNSPSLVNPWADLYPNGPPLPFSFDPATVNYAPATRFNLVGFDPDYHTAYTLQMNLSVEREVINGVRVEAGYVGNRGFDNPVALDLNAPLWAPGATDAGANINARRPYQRYNQVRMFFPMEDTTYDALNVAGTIARGRLNGRVTYVYQTSNSVYALGNDSIWGSGNAQVGAIQDKDSFDYLQGNNLPNHLFRVFMVYELPGYESNLLNTLAGGWQVGGNFHFQSGLPLAVNAGRDINFNGVGPDRADQVGPVNYLKTLDARGNVQWFDPSAFAVPALANAANPYPRGNSMIGAVIGPRAWTMDASLTKRFALQGRTAIEVRLDAMNLLNHANLGNPNTTVTSADFGKSTSWTAPFPFNNISGPRTLMLGGRFQF
jgi:hypothetical protein